MKGQKLDLLYQKLYETYASGIISEDKFKMLSSSYEEEKKRLQVDRASDIWAVDFQNLYD